MRDNTYNSEYMPVYFICLSEIGRKHTQPLQQVYHILYKKTITKFFLCKYIFHKNKKYAAEKPRTEKRIICYCCHTTFSNPNENEKRGCIFTDCKNYIWIDNIELRGNYHSTTLFHFCQHHK